MKIMDYLDTESNTPQGLQDKVFVDILKHFGRRGQEGLRQLHKRSFIIKVDSNGQKYATIMKM